MIYKNISHKVSSEIAQYPGVMKQFSAKEIEGYMSSGQTTLALSKDNKHLLGFCKYIVHPSTGDHTQDIVEIGSLVVTKGAKGKGIAKQLFVECIDLAKSKHPDLKIISMVSIHNIPSNKLHEKIGYKKIDFPANIPHLIPGVKNTYQLSSGKSKPTLDTELIGRNFWSLVQIIRTAVRRRRSRPQRLRPR